MNELEIKSRLEKALHTRITQAEWHYLKGVWASEAIFSDQMAREVAEDWQEFRDLAAGRLKLLRRYEQDKIREQAGELGFGPETSPSGAPGQSVDVPASFSDRTSARAGALASLNRLRTGGASPGRPPIHGTLLPRGGVDGTLAQWVYVVAAELWVPAEEVADIYRAMQKTMLAESNPPKTRARQFEVAAFVWDNERVHGKRPPWRVLCESWNKRPLTEPLEDWRDFHKAFSRGAKATPPRYVASNEQITNQVSSGSRQQVFDMWASKVRE